MAVKGNSTTSFTLPTVHVRPFQCSVCSSSFKRPEHLKRHQRSHEQSRRFTCTVCDKKFTRSDILAKHSSIHTHPARLAELRLAQGSQEARQRRRACLECARVREKCTKGQPCSRCSLRHLPCVYPTTRSSEAEPHRRSSPVSATSQSVFSAAHEEGDERDALLPSSFRSPMATMSRQVTSMSPTERPDPLVVVRHPRLSQAAAHMFPARPGGASSYVAVSGAGRGVSRVPDNWSSEEDAFDSVFGGAAQQQAATSYASMVAMTQAGPPPSFSARQRPRSHMTAAPRRQPGVSPPMMYTPSFRVTTQQPQTFDGQLRRIRSLGYACGTVYTRPGMDHQTMMPAGATDVTPVLYSFEHGLLQAVPSGAARIRFAASQGDRPIYT